MGRPRLPPLPPDSRDDPTPRPTVLATQLDLPALEAFALRHGVYTTSSAPTLHALTHQRRPDAPSVCHPMALPALAQELLAAAQAAHPAPLFLPTFLETVPPQETLVVRGMAVGLAVDHLVKLGLLDLGPQHLHVALTPAGVAYQPKSEA